MAEQFSGRQRHSLGRRIHRCVRRMLEDMKSVQKNPHRMWRIGQPAMSKSVCRQQIAEFIVNFRLWHRLPRQKRHSREDGDRADRQEGQPLVSGKPGE